jgi:hypothetical protein
MRSTCCLHEVCSQTLSSELRRVLRLVAFVRFMSNYNNLDQSLFLRCFTILNLPNTKFSFEVL